MSVAISPRLMPGVCVAGAWIQVEPTTRTGRDGKPVWAWFVDLPDGREFQGEDLRGRGDAKRMLEDLLAFLGACGESVNYAERTGRKGENADLFPAELARWCAENGDALAVARFELEEGGGV